MSLEEILTYCTKWADTTYLVWWIIFQRGLVNKRAQSMSSGLWRELQKQIFESHVYKPWTRFRPQLVYISCKFDSSWHFLQGWRRKKTILSPIPGLQPIYSCRKMELFFFIIATGVSVFGPTVVAAASAQRQKRKQIGNSPPCPCTSLNRVCCLSSKTMHLRLYMSSYISITLQLRQCHPQGAWKLGFNVSWEAHTRQK